MERFWNADLDGTESLKVALGQASQLLQTGVLFEGVSQGLSFGHHGAHTSVEVARAVHSASVGRAAKVERFCRGSVYAALGLENFNKLPQLQRFAPPG